MQPKIKKLKNVNYYKHMKEKFKAKREQADNEEKKIQEFLDSRNQTMTKFGQTNRDGFGTTKSVMSNQIQIKKNLAINNTSQSENI